jgi:murein DD-endopeptidase MepM/ murein hydrolase activator NlpD
MKLTGLFIQIIFICLFIGRAHAQNLYAGVWEEATDGYFLWAGQEWAGFEAKWKELSKQNLRLIDIETYVEGGKRRYSGVWRAGSDGHYLWAGQEWAGFEAKWKELSRQNLRLIDIETYVDGGKRKYIGVWRAGSDGHFLWAGQEWAGFEAKWKELSGKNLRLIDIETYVDGGKRKYIGVWRAGSGGHYLWAGQEWAGFQAKWKELASQNLRLIDMETYEEGGKRKYTGVWKQGSKGHYLWAGVDWENFTSKWAENGQNKLRLVDLETYPSSCASKCLNTALMPDDPSTSARDGYNYQITGSGLHCANEPNSCAGNTANVTYRWPNVQYDGKFYLRLSAIYDAKDKIFTLPFKEKTSDMRTNGWRYSNGNWHHALDYSRKDGKTFQVCAAAPGRVIYFGWDNWSGGTMIVSHDVGTKKDVYRTIYMHLRNGPAADCESAWTNTMPSLDKDQKAVYKKYLEDSGCPEKKADRKPKEAQWGTNSQTANTSLVGKTVKAGDVLGWAGDTGPGGCGCMNGGSGPNTHLHLFFAHRDPTDNRWYFFDPYGIYGTPDCYPSNVDSSISTACSRYPVSWKGGKPSAP